MSTSKSSPSRPDRATRTQSSYNALAEEYAKRISDELGHRPRERELLEQFAARCRHQGEEEFGVAIDLDATFFTLDDFVSRLGLAGLTIMEQFERDPYPDVEYQSVRAYIWATKPS